ncbi:MAG: hypothetical protein ABI637_08790 [Gemmatimonadota bacterium]
MHLRDPYADNHEDRTSPRSTEVEFDREPRIVVGLFHDRRDAQDAARALRNAGFSDDRVGVAVPDIEGVPPSAPSRTNRRTRSDGTPRDSLAGGVLGVLSGVGSRMVPGVGPLLAAGWLGAAMLETRPDTGLADALRESGVAISDADHFEAGVRAGGALVSVHAGSRYLETRLILREYGADLGPTAFGELLRDDRDGDRRYHDDLSYAGPERRLSD